LRGGLHGLALLLSELVLEPLLFGGRRLTDLFELSLKDDDPLLLLRRVLKLVSPTFGPLC
jgi:hypothetical protein